MTAFTFGEAARRVLAPGRIKPPRTPRRTGAPVRRDSLEAGTFEELFFAAPAPGETDRLLRVARAALDAGRKLRRAARAEGRDLGAAERRLASLTAGAVRVYEELLTLARLARGRLYPSYDRLSASTGLGRATVARAIACLEAVGFLVRQRRFVRVDGEGTGPRYAQTSNAYRLLQPAGLRRFLPRWMTPAPLPDCEAQREADRAHAQAGMLATLSCRELATATVSGTLGQVLARLGVALDRRQCESHDDPQPLTQFINSCQESEYPGSQDAKSQQL